MALTIGQLVGYIQADDSGMQRGLTAAELRMRGFQRDTEGRLRHLDGRFADSGELMALGLSQGTNEGNRLGLSLGRIGSMAGSLLGAAGSVGRIAAVLGAAAPLAAGVVATLANIAPAAGVAATGIVAVQLATNAVKIGMSGVQEAVKAAFDTENPEKFEEALKKLSPNARAFVLELKGMSKEFDALKQDVQDRLFTKLDDVLRGLGEYTLPIVRNGLVNAAGAVNLMARGVGNAAIGLSRSGALGTAISSANIGLFNLSRIPSQVVAALVQVASAAGPSFERLTAAAGDAFDGISEKISDAFASGRMQEAIESAIDLIGDLAEIGGNVGSVLGSIFSAAQVSGGGFIGTLKEITGALAEAFASKPVQDGLKALFGTMSLLAKTAAPLLGQALGVIAPVLMALAPPLQELIKALGDDLGPLIAELGPVLVEAAVAVGTLVLAALPLIGITAQLAVWIAQVINAMPPGTLAVIASAWVAISLGIKAYGLYTMIAAGATRAWAIAQGIFNAVMMLNPIGLVIGLIVALVAAIVIAYQNSETFRKIVQDVWKAVQKAVEVAVDGIMTAVDWFKELPGKMSRWFGQAKDWAIRKFLELISWLAGLPGRANRALSGLGGALRRRAAEAGVQLVSMIRQKVSDAIAWVKGLPGRARSALSGLGSALQSAGRSLISGFIKGIISKFGDVKGALGSLTSSLTDWKGPEDVDKTILTPAGRMVIAGFQKGIAGQIPSLRAQLQQITRELPDMGLPDYAMSGAGIGGGAVGSAAVPQQRLHVDIEVSGPEPIKRLIRGIVATDGGGSVQATFGRGKG